MNDFFKIKRLITLLVLLVIFVIALVVSYTKLAFAPVTPIAKNKPTVERGSIVDRSGYPLAVQTNFYHVGVSVKNLKDSSKSKENFAQNIAPVLDMTESEVMTILNTSKSFCAYWRCPRTPKARKQTYPLL